jgi:hypothetical protein
MAPVFGEEADSSEPNPNRLCLFPSYEFQHAVSHNSCAAEALSITGGYGVPIMENKLKTKAQQEHSVILTPDRDPFYNRGQLIRPPIGKESLWAMLRLSR